MTFLHRGPHRAVLAVALSTLLAIVADGAGAPGTLAGLDPAAGEPADGPGAAIRARIEGAFLRCDADALRPALAGRGKIYVSAALLGAPAGYYGADQLLVLFHRLFEGKTTIRLSAISSAAVSPREGRSVYPVEWIYSEDGSPHSQARLAFGLACGRSGCSIREIREMK
ncbi:MAG: hypothetical protein ACE5JH_04540 [Acidobacteriota bacterium]